MTVYLAYEDDGEYVSAVFSSQEAARQTFGDDVKIEAQEVFDAPLPEWKYWHRGAAVYPDGTFDEWNKESAGKGIISIPPCDDHLNCQSEPWDGHTQHHCGEHISIFGTDLELVEQAFQKHLRLALSRQNGACQSRFGQHRGGVDGITTYEQGFMCEPRQRKEGR